jgi:hypothetical protein
MKIQSDVVSSTYHKVAICIPTLFLYPTELAIQKMIEASQRMITINSQGELGGINPAIKKHYELQIKTLLQNAPRRDCGQVGTAFENKRKAKGWSNVHGRHTRRLVTEIEMLKVVLYLVCRNNDDMHARTTSNNQQH